MFFNCFKYKNAGFEVLFLQNCKVYFGHIIGFGNHLPLGPGHVSLVLFEPFRKTASSNSNIGSINIATAAVTIATMRAATATLAVSTKQQQQEQ